MNLEMNGIAKPIQRIFSGLLALFGWVAWIWLMITMPLDKEFHFSTISAAVVIYAVWPVGNFLFSWIAFKGKLPMTLQKMPPPPREQ